MMLEKRRMNVVSVMSNAMLKDLQLAHGIALVIRFGAGARCEDLVLVAE
jgi:hypothetical protein